jgi:hypothetical protein
LRQAERGHGQGGFDPLFRRADFAQDTRFGAMERAARSASIFVTIASFPASCAAARERHILSISSTCALSVGSNLKRTRGARRLDLKHGVAGVDAPIAGLRRR